MSSRWIIPDIHGYAKTLRTLIETHIRPEMGDELIFLGDYIDRGPGSKEVIDYVCQLRNDGYRVTALRGNHEAALLELVKDRQNRRSPWRWGGDQRYERAWLEMGGDATLRSYGVQKASDLPPATLEWINALGWYLVLDDFVVVHAGLNFGPDDPFEDQRAMLWVREFAIQRERIGGRRIVHGHVPVSLEMINLSVNNPAIPFIDLDNGPYIRDRIGFGNLCALELNSMRLVIQDNVD